MAIQQGCRCGNPSVFPTFPHYELPPAPDGESPVTALVLGVKQKALVPKQIPSYKQVNSSLLVPAVFLVHMLEGVIDMLEEGVELFHLIRQYLQEGIFQTEFLKLLVDAIDHLFSYQILSLFIKFNLLIHFLLLKIRLFGNH